MVAAVKIKLIFWRVSTLKLWERGPAGTLLVGRRTAEIRGGARGDVEWDLNNQIDTLYRNSCVYIIARLTLKSM
jgi:hypothetical protein